MGISADIDDFDDTMDLWGIFMFFFIAFFIMSCCGYCCSRKQRGAVLSAPVVVTSTTHNVPGGYTVAQIPVGATPTSYQTQSYVTPYPTQGNSVHMPMPMPMPMPTGQPVAPGVHPTATPYPTMAATNMNPPSYEAAVSGAAAGQYNSSIYAKQSAYNPNYAM